MHPRHSSIARQFRSLMVVLTVLLTLLLTGVAAADQRPAARSAGAAPGTMHAVHTHRAAVACAPDSSPGPAGTPPASDPVARLLAAEHARIIARLGQMSPAEAWLLELDVPASIARHTYALDTLRGTPARLAAVHGRLLTRLQQMSPAEAWLLEIDVAAGIAEQECMLASAAPGGAR